MKLKTVVFCLWLWLLTLALTPRAVADNSISLGDRWRDCMKSAKLAIIESKHEEAKGYLTKALNIAKLENSLDEVMQTTRSFTEEYLAEKDYSAGADFCKWQLDFLESRNGKPEVIFPVLCDLGIFYEDLGKISLAEDCEKKSLALSRKSPNADRMLRLAPYTCLAEIYAKTGALRKASALQKNIIKMQESNGFVHGCSFAYDVGILAQLYRRENRLEESAAQYQRALTLFKSNGSCDFQREYELAHEYLILLRTINRDDEADIVESWIKRHKPHDGLLQQNSSD